MFSVLWVQGGCVSPLPDLTVLCCRPKESSIILLLWCCFTPKSHGPLFSHGWRPSYLLEPVLPSCCSEVWEPILWAAMRGQFGSLLSTESVVWAVGHPSTALVGAQVSPFGSTGDPWALSTLCLNP